MVEKLLSRSLKVFQSDNGVEYMINDIKAFIQSWGIVQMLTVWGYPYQTWGAEILNEHQWNSFELCSVGNQLPTILSWTIERGSLCTKQGYDTQPCTKIHSLWGTARHKTKPLLSPCFWVQMLVHIKLNRCQQTPQPSTRIHHNWICWGPRRYKLWDINKQYVVASRGDVLFEESDHVAYKSWRQ